MNCTSYSRAKFALSPSEPATDTTPPTVSLTYDLKQTSITLSAQANDNIGVAKIQFYFDGKLIASDTLAPYTATYKVKRNNQNHTLSAIAYDKTGNATTSQQIVKY